MTDGGPAPGPRRARWFAAACLLGLAGCGGTTPVLRDVDGLPCTAPRKTQRPASLCAARPAPPADVERQVKRFEPLRDDAQVVVHWLARAGATRPLTLQLDGRAVAELLPGGLARLRLAPGAHELAVAWGGRPAVLALRALPGTLLFAEVGARFNLRDAEFGWQPPDEAGARRRAAAARVIADVDLRDATAGGGSVAPSP